MNNMQFPNNFIIPEERDYIQKFTTAFQSDQALELLLDECKIDINKKIKTIANGTLLHLTAHIPNISKNCIKLLVERGGDVHAKSHFHKTPLHSAAFHGNSSLMIALLENKAEINALDMQNNTPLHVRVVKKDISDLSSIKILLEAGADLTIKNSKGMTPIEAAEKSDPNGNCVKILKTWEKQQQLWDQWVLEEPDYKNSFQWLPREMVEDTLNLM